MALFQQERTAEVKVNLAGFTFMLFAVTLILLYAGGFTTTIGAGMVFLDWPLSNGSLNPPGWTADEAMLAEHSHRLLGMMTGTLSICLVIWMYRREARRWVRLLSYGVLGFVIFQGLLGGLRVLLVSVDLAKIHGITAQLFLCLIVAVAAASSRWWRNVPVALDGEDAGQWRVQRILGVVLCALLIAQLVIGAVMRHRGAGLAIPYFPFSTADGAWLPPTWNWATTIHFAHRAMAVVIGSVLVTWAIRILRLPTASTAMKRLAVAALILLVTQIALGAGIIWTLRKPIETTLHVLNGALLLSATWCATFTFFRPLFAEEVALAPKGSATASKRSSASAPSRADDLGGAPASTHPSAS
jgi:cytochrome c oxidase assembly protein subunit 15